MSDNRILKEIKHFNNGSSEYKTDIVIAEKSFEILVNGNHLVTLSVLPSNLKELALGFLHSEGLISNKHQISKIDFDEKNLIINFDLDISERSLIRFKNSGEKTSGCGSSLTSTITGEQSDFAKLSIKAEEITKQMKDFVNSSTLFKETGGVHLAGLQINNKLSYLSEDIGRHNAVDKVIGAAIHDKVDISRSILFCSGRISSEIVRKAIRTKIPMIVSKSAATSKAISLGWEYGVYLIGFTRGNRFNLYTGIDNLILE